MHLFYTLEKSWTSAKDLEPGDTVVTLSGEKYKIETIDKDYYDGIIVVYNFEVEDNHNYYVGDNQVLVHNDGCTVSDKGSSRTAYYEFKSLRQQGYNATEAYDLIKQFRQGINTRDEFAFHFTSLEGGKGITSSGKLNPTKRGLRGPGVYAGTTPTPSWALKHIPYSGWGLGVAPVRIPIKINSKMPVKYVKWPFKVVIFRTSGEPLKLVP